MDERNRAKDGKRKSGRFRAKDTTEGRNREGNLKKKESKSGSELEGEEGRD